MYKVVIPITYIISYAIVNHKLIFFFVLMIEIMNHLKIVKNYVTMVTCTSVAKHISKLKITWKCSKYITTYLLFFFVEKNCMVFAWTFIFVGFFSGLCLFFGDFFHLPAGIQIWLTRDDKLVFFDHYFTTQQFFFSTE